MKKAQVLKYLPNLKALRKDIKAKNTLINKLEHDVSKVHDDLTRLELIASELDGVTLHNEFPVCIQEDDGPDPWVEVFSGCDDATRFAYVNRESAHGDTPERWRATGYKEEGSGEGKVLAEGVSRTIALRAGKDYVAGVKAVKPDEKATAQGPSKPGRKSKASN
jgi:hypothetical protein